MARPTNRQLRSVGNLGDILKHAALAEIGAMFASAHAAVSYVDTHAFLLRAPPADLEKWRREIDGLAGTPAYARYAELEHAFIARTGRYRCSSGLVVDVLGDRRGFTSLGEANAVTRAELRAQIADEQRTNIVVSSDAVAALRDARVGEGEALLVHIDPFALTPTLWASLEPALDATLAKAVDAALVVYRYTRSARSAWPAAPKGVLGPVAETRGGPHELAAYASASVAGAVREICNALGWGTASPNAHVGGTPGPSASSRWR